MRRENSVLPDFGGGKAYNVDPITGIADQFGSAAMEYANRAYSRNAMIGWVKEVSRRGRNDWLPSGVSPKDYRNMFLQAEVKGSDSFARRMREIQDIEKRRMNTKGPAQLRMESLGQQMSEYIFDKTKLVTKPGDPSNALLQIGFQSAFGFLNMSQFLIQGLHASTIMLFHLRPVSRVPQWVLPFVDSTTGPLM